MTLRHKQACAACASVRVHSVSHQRVSLMRGNEREPGETQHALRCNLNTPPEAQGHASTVRHLLCTPEGPKGLVQRPEEDRLRRECSRIFENVRECSRMFSNVLSNVREHSRMFSEHSGCSRRKCAKQAIPCLEPGDRSSQFKQYRHSPSANSIGLRLKAAPSGAAASVPCLRLLRRPDEYHH